MSLSLATTLLVAATQIPSPLSLRQAIDLAEHQAFDIETAELAVLSAQGDLRAAHGITNPTWSYSRTRLRHYDPQLPATQGWGWGVSDTSLFDALTGKRWLRQDVAEAALKAALATKDDVRRTVLFAVKQAYAQALLADATLRLQRDTLKTYEQTLELARHRYQAGAITEIDLARFDTAELEAEQALDQARQQLLQAKAQLGFLLGRRVAGDSTDAGAELSGFTLAEELEAQPTPPLPDQRALLKTALANRPDVKAAEQAKAKAEASLALARRQRIPDVTLSYQYSELGQFTNATTPPTMQLGVAAALPVFYQQQGEILRAGHDAEAAGVGVEKARAQVATDVAQASAAAEAARQLVARMHSGGLLERSAKARDLLRITYEKGAASLLDFLDAERTFIATRLEYLTDLVTYRVAVAQLEQATSSDLLATEGP